VSSAEDFGFYTFRDDVESDAEALAAEKDPLSLGLAAEGKRQLYRFVLGSIDS